MSKVIDLRRLRKPAAAAAVIAALLLLACWAFSWYYPLKHIGIIRKYAAEYGLAPSLVCAVIHAESKFDEAALSRKGASGLMQIVRGSADWAAAEIGIPGYDYSRVREPEINIRIGCWLLARLTAQFGDTDTALAAYNAGSGNVSKWLKNPAYSADGVRLTSAPFRETENYLRRVRFNLEIYRFILGDEA